MTPDQKLDRLMRDVSAIRVWQAGREERLRDVEERQHDTDERVTALERWRWMVLGGAAAASLVVNPLISAWVGRK